MSEYRLAIKITADGSQALPAVHKVTDALTRIPDGANGAAGALDKIPGAMQRVLPMTVRVVDAAGAIPGAFVQAGAAASAAAGRIGQIEQAGQAAAASSERLVSAVARVGHYGAGLLVLSQVGQFARGAVTLADEFAGLSGRIALVSNSTEQATLTQRRLFEVAQQTRSGLGATTELFTKLSTSTESMGLSQDRLLKVTRTIGQAMALSGGDAQSMNAAIVQLSQGLGSGALRGDELNSVIEQTPALAKAIAEGMGRTVAELRKLGEEGKITGAAVVQALENMAGKVENDFSKLPMTVSQAMTQVNNALLQSVGVFDQSNGLSRELAQGISLLAQNMGTAVGVAGVLAGALVGRLGSASALALQAMVAARAARIADTQATLVQAQAEAARTAAALASAQATARQAAVLGTATAQKAAATAAEVAHTAAITAQAAAQTAATRAASLSAGVVGLLGGPIGIVTTLLGAGVAAWMAWGGASRKAEADAAGAMAVATDTVVADLDRQIAKLKERNRLAAVAPTVAGADTPAVEKLAGLQAKIDQLKSGTGFASAMSAPERAANLAGYTQQFDALKTKLQDFNAEQEKAKSIAGQPAREAWLEKYATDAQKLQAELKKAREDFGGLIPPDLEQRIRAKFAGKGGKADDSALDAQREAAKQWADAVADMVKAEQAAQAAGEGLTATQARLVAYLTSPAYAEHSDAMRQVVVQQYAAATAAEQLAAAEKLAADTIRAASASADTIEARVQALEDEERAALLAAGGLMNLAQAVEAVAIARLQDARAQALSFGDEARAAALQREITARERLIELSGRKEARDAVQRGGERQKSESERRLEGYLSRDIGTDLSAGFDKASQSLGQFVQQFVRLNDEQSAYLQAQRDAGANTDKLAAVEARHAQAQISGYAAMAGAAKGMFAQNSAGYRAMAAAEKALRVAQLAGAISTAAKQIGLIGAVTTAKVGGDAAMALSDTTRAGVEQSNSFLTAAAKGAEAVVNAIRSLPFPANLAAGVATAAAVAALGVRILGGGGGGGARAGNTGTGTVLGDPQAQSQSIGNSTQRLEQVNTETMRYSAQMLDSLRSIEGNIGGLTALLVRSGGVQGLSDGLNYSGSGALASVAKGVADVFTLGLLPQLGNAVARVVGGRSRVTGEGVSFGAQTLGSVLASGQLAGSAFVNYRERKNYLDDWDKRRKTGALDASIEAQFGKVFAGINATLVSAADALGLGGERMRTALAAYVVQIGDINLKGLSAAEQSERISAVLSAESDRIVKAVLSEALPLIDGFAQVGEGYLETLTRMATGSEQAGLALRRLGVQMVGLADVANQQATDIGAELVRTSLVAAETVREITGYTSRWTGRRAIITETVSGIGEIIATLDGSADELAGAYVSLVNLRTAFGALGLAGSAVTRDLLAGAGGIDALADGLSAYEEGFATTSERLSSQGAVVRDAFQRLGLAMPTTAQAFRDLVRGIDTSTASGQELLGQVLGLSGGLRELLDAVQSTTSGITDEIGRIRGLMSSGSTAGQSLVQLQSSFAIRAAQAKAGDAAALEGLPDASRALLDAAADLVGSRADLLRLQAGTANTLQGVADAVNAAALDASSGSPAADRSTPAAAVPVVQAVSDPALQDVLAEMQALRRLTQTQAEQAARRDAQIVELQQSVAAATAETARVLRDITPNGSSIAVSLEAGGL